MSKHLVTIQIENLDGSNPDSVQAFLNSLIPQVAENIAAASTATRSRGCSVSGSVSGSSAGGVSGTVTVTCN